VHRPNPLDDAWQEEAWQNCRPSLLPFLHLDQCGAKKVASGLRLPTLHNFGNFLKSASDFFLVARIAAEQKIVEVQPVEHDLIANGFNGAHALQRG